MLAAIDGPLPVETHAPETALGLVLAIAVAAATDLPPWDNSAMDGYAIRAADVSAATEDAPVTLRVVGEVPAGGIATVRVEAGTAIRIATGAPLPAGADAVVAVELTTPLSADGSVAGPRGRDATGPVPAACAVHEAVSPGSAVRRRGEDLRAGDTVLEAGTVMTPAAIAIAAGSGVDAVAVHRRPRIAVLATGDEVRAPGEPLGDAGIPDANGPGLRAMVEAAGGVAVRPRDRPRRPRRRPDPAAARAGRSGCRHRRRRRLRRPVRRRQDVPSRRSAASPCGGSRSSPASRSPSGDRPTAVVLFGLPGNPVSGFVTFELFVRPAIRRLAGHRRLLRDTDVGTLDQAVTKAPAAGAHSCASGRARPRTIDPSAMRPAGSGSGSPAARAATS